MEEFSTGECCGLICVWKALSGYHGKDGAGRAKPGQGATCRGWSSCTFEERSQPSRNPEDEGERGPHPGHCHSARAGDRCCQRRPEEEEILCSLGGHQHSSWRRWHPTLVLGAGFPPVDSAGPASFSQEVPSSNCAEGRQYGSVRGLFKQMCTAHL